MDICEYILGCRKEDIRRDVIVAPCWTPQSVGVVICKIKSSRSCSIWDCILDNMNFTYIVTGVGATFCMDIILALKNTPCRRVLFLGSAGALKRGINIGDLAVPFGSISGDGVTRYIGNTISQDIFGKPFFATASLQKHLITSCHEYVKGKGISVHTGMGISVGSILLQYNHLDEIMSFNCNFIDLESAAFFAASSAVNLKMAAVFCISDNVVQNEPLYDVSFEKNVIRKKIRYNVIPMYIKEFLLWKE